MKGVLPQTTLSTYSTDTWREWVGNAKYTEEQIDAQIGCDAKTFTAALLCLLLTFLYVSLIVPPLAALIGLSPHSQLYQTPSWSHSVRSSHSVLFAPTIHQSSWLVLLILWYSFWNCIRYGFNSWRKIWTRDTINFLSQVSIKRWNCNL